MKDRLHQIQSYYSEKLKVNGCNHKGVDWNSVESQELRFKQISAVCNFNINFSINDLGCGYGALYEYLNNNHTTNFTYYGHDISPNMIEAAQRSIGYNENVYLYCDASPKPKDYTVASGIFNVKLESSDEEWKQHMLDTIATMNEASERGFAFNVLTKYCDREYQKSYLYYADPCYLLEHCLQKYSRSVSLLHDYNLYEFTMIVRKG